jgi:hypothetical protein
MIGFVSSSKLIMLLFIDWRHSCSSLQDLTRAFSLFATAVHPVLRFPTTVTSGAAAFRGLLFGRRRSSTCAIVSFITVIRRRLGLLLDHIAGTWDRVICILRRPC